MIRSAEVKDVKEINKLGKLINKDFVKLFPMKTILKEEFSKVFVYEDNKKIVAFLHITELYETIDIINIVVDPIYRNKKIATLLLDYMMSDANSIVEIVTLEVDTSNEAAIKLYKNFGFEVINTRKSYYSDKDAYLMVRELRN